MLQLRPQDLAGALGWPWAPRQLAMEACPSSSLTAGGQGQTGGFVLMLRDHLSLGIEITREEIP